MGQRATSVRGLSRGRTVACVYEVPRLVQENRYTFGVLSSQARYQMRCSPHSGLWLGVSLAVGTAAPPFPPSGAAAWTYDATGGQPAEWAPDIASFNAAAVQPISMVFSYGGDMEW